MERGPRFPESNNRVPPERGGSTFPVKVGPRTPTETPGNKNIAPTTEEIDAANNGAYAGSTETVKKVGGNRVLKAVLGVGTVIGTGAIVYEAVPAVHQAVDSAFLNHLKGKSLQPISSTQAEAPTTEINNNNPNSSINKSKEEVFDPTATKGVISEKNSILMTYEEYEKITPPLIERENRKEIPVEITTPTGNRQIIIEQGTGVNAVIFIRTPEGGMREVHSIKKENPSQLIKHIGTTSSNVSFSNCSEYLGQKNEIQAGDIFPAPITGEVHYYGNRINYYKGEKTEEGTVNAWYYYIEGEYVDEDGKKFEAVARIDISSYSDLTKPLVEDMPNMKDYESSREDKEKMPRVTVTQGNSLFKFVTKPSFKSFSSDSKEPEAQIKIKRGYFEKGGNRSGGEKCLNPSLDGKRIVPLQ